MSEKETSAEIATLAAHILQHEPIKAIGRNPTVARYNDLLAKAKRLAGSALSQREVDDSKMVAAIPTTTLVDWEKVTNAIVGFAENGYSPWAQRFEHVLTQPSMDLASAARGTDKIVWYNDPAFWTGGGEATVRYDAPEDDEGTFRAIKTIRKPDLVNGLAIMAEKYPRHFADLLNENDDADTHDVFMQCVVLGEVVYG